jgi:hypothetical protein
VLAFLGYGVKETPENRYCQACRELGEDDCANCDPSKIEELTNG